MGIIDLSNNKTIVYQKTNLSIIRSLEYYVKNTLIITLISNEDLKKSNLSIKNL